MPALHLNLSDCPNRAQRQFDVFPGAGGGVRAVWQDSPTTQARLQPTTATGDGSRWQSGTRSGSVGQALVDRALVDRADDLARVRDVVGVERLLDRAHQRHRLAMLLVEELDLAETDA